ncbi:hypothetical protein UA08_03921 [Talaromyces atroroseus]|uniref:DNA repair protein RAD16 n=1 Tax=Talaromyces atroroseus TaxID=1441469 RepID=A0A225ANG1_TALAT|nr:hypothetical protein UA08_03921 [Talaromyces atroroseus]OKL60993.1 hypothetical protein UA08_03921 [Talaromyces atroroseus]
MARRVFAKVPGTPGNLSSDDPALTNPIPNTLPVRRRSARLSRSLKDDAVQTTPNSEPTTLKPTGRATRTSSVMIEVAIPTKMKESISQASSLSPPSVGSTSRDESVQDDTPATSVAVTPPESDHSRRQPKTRISASARAQQLRSSTFALPSSTSTKRKRSASQMANGNISTESSDAALARELQLEEYGGIEAKRQRTFTERDDDQTIQDSEDELSPYWNESSDHGHVPRGPKLRRSLRSRPSSQLIDGDDIPMLDADSTFANKLEDTSDEEDYVYSSDDNAAYEPTTQDLQDNTRASTSYESKNVAKCERTCPATSLSNGTTVLTIEQAARERRKLEKQHPSIISMWKDLEDTPPIIPVQAAQPTGISRTLKSFQLEGLNWMMRQEQTQYKGGLLGDEMGMGKTIQAVSLLMSDYPVGKPSLVVVPPVALMQWQSEIKEYTDGKLKVLVHHNSSPKIKHLKRKDLLSYDVIMISYSGLESMYRKEQKGWQREDGLVKENSVIHSIDFHRLILDEAHSIKQRTTSVARACFALKSTYKWCLSGTPVQNRIGEFFSLLRFLEVRPFACYFCKMCKCQELHWSQDAEKKCTHCRHSGFSHVSVFNQEILNPITESSGQARKDALQKLRLITDRIMLRRIKRDHTASMELPPKRIIIHNEFFGEIERDFSSSIMTNSTRQFDTYVSRGVMLNNYANIFGLIMQMRQVANHPDLILKKHAEGGQNVLVCNICDEPAESPIRSRCHHEFCRQCAKDYMRSFDADTIVDCPRCHIPLSIDFEQPEIEQEEDVVKKNSIINRIRMEDWTSSTKIEMLVYDLYKLRSQKQTHKSIVFSQFTSMLQLVEWRLRRAGFNTVMLDGSMTPAQRQNSIDHFMKNVDVEVFLVSLKAGGVALNLTEASRVFIVDPWWNPAAEWQSADRCHRIGQRRPCVITRLCIEDSVESRMVLLQEKKANMINGTINKDQGEALEKLTPEDMQFLFRGS